MSKLVVIENTVVRQDAFGRYCLNDLHKAAGELEKTDLNIGLLMTKLKN